MTTAAIWLGYLCWLALFVWLGWRQNRRPLAILSAVVLVMFAGLWVWAASAANEPGWNGGGSFAAGLMLMFAGFVLVVPPALGGISFLISKFWARV